MVAINPYFPKPHYILDIVKETEIEYTFRVESDFTPNFGQFLQVSIPKIGEAPISISDFGDGWVDLTIRRIGKVTSGVHDLNVGDKLFLRGPYGNGFSMNEIKNKHLIIAAGGTGLAPVRSLMNYFMNNKNEIKSLNILLGFKDYSCILFKRDIKRWKNEFNLTITIDNASCGTWEGEYLGLITEHIHKVAHFELLRSEIIVIGPPVMIKHTVAEFIKYGVSKEKIIVSFERKMSCGIGKCGHCKMDSTYICLEGPIFRFSQAEKLFD